MTSRSALLVPVVVEQLQGVKADYQQQQEAQHPLTPLISCTLVSRVTAQEPQDYHEEDDVV